MLDPRVRGSGDLRLGMIGNAETGRLKHGDVVGAVAYGEALAELDRARFGGIDQRLQLPLCSDDRFAHGAAQPPLLDEQRIRDGAVEARSEEHTSELQSLMPI